MNDVIRVFNVGYKWAGNVTRIRVNGKGIIGNAHSSYNGEEDGVKHTGGGPKPKPLINEDEHRWEVDECNGGYHDDDVEGEFAATFHFPTLERSPPGDNLTAGWIWLIQWERGLFGVWVELSLIWCPVGPTS